MSEDSAEPTFDKVKAEEHKSAGNGHFSKQRYDAAIDEYTEAIGEDPTNAVYWSNRAFCHLKMENFGSAVSDATEGIKVNKRYVKSYYRRGAAYMGMGKFQAGLKNFQQVLKLFPKDRDAKKKQVECQKQVHAAAFARAIESEDSKPASETTDWSSISVAEDYEGPRYDSDAKSMTLDFIIELMAYLKDQKNLHHKYVIRIIMEMIPLLRSLPTLVDVGIKEGEHLTVCGDVHGQYYDVLNIFELNGLPSDTNPYLFNGDFVDRGSFSLEVILVFFCFKLLYPKHMHLTRGNHESDTMNQIYGFKGEVNSKVNTQAFDLFSEAFTWLPLGHVVANKVLVVHGGLFSEDGVKLKDLRKVKRNMQPPDKGLMCEMLWSDPQAMNGRAPSKRGVGLSFGPDVTKRFLDDNNLNLIIRSHEVKSDGYEVEADGQLITIFSAPNYCDSMGNKGAFIRLEHDLVPKMTTFSAVPHPAVAPMAYSSPMFRM